MATNEIATLLATVVARSKAPAAMSNQGVNGSGFLVFRTRKAPWMTRAATMIQKAMMAVMALTP